MTECSLSSRLDTDHSCWVTVFGFPLSLSSLILQQFESDGEILQHESGQGNWMSIRFRSPLDAKKALGKNGKIITDNIMIGVLPSDKVCPSEVLLLSLARSFLYVLLFFCSFLSLLVMLILSGR